MVKILKIFSKIFRICLYISDRTKIYKTPVRVDSYRCFDISTKIIKNHLILFRYSDIIIALFDAKCTHGEFNSPKE